MTPEVLIDYANPCLNAELALKKLHDAMLHNDYDMALEAGIEALTETRMTINAIKHMEEQHALRQQAQTV